MTTTPRPSAASTAARAPRVCRGRPAFSLTELVVVVLIIGVIIAIIVPALGGARDAARAQTTRNVMSQISNAAESFRLDQRRYPGYYNAREMGSSSNGGTGGLPGSLSQQGLSAAENVMLDLASSDAIFTQQDPSRVRVGPSSLSLGLGGNAQFEPGGGGTQITGNEIYVNPGLIGTGSNAYYVPSGEFFVEQTSTFDTDPNGSGVQQVSRPVFGHTGNPGDPQLPDLVDAFGSPLLIWSANEERADALENVQQFGARTTESATAGPTVFSWNANAAFLRANELGRGGANMNVSPTDATGRAASLIGAGAVAASGGSDANIGAMLAMFLGSPSYPAEEILRTPGIDYYTVLHPTRPRGNFIVHSGGRDQVYFSNRDRAVRTYLSDSVLSRGGGTWRPGYGINFGPVDAGGDRWEDDAGKPISIDFAAEFDDVLVSTN